MNDLPAILADLARLERERFQVLGTERRVFRVRVGDAWDHAFDGGSPSATDLALVQAAVQEAIVARGWEYAILRYQTHVEALLAPHGLSIPDCSVPNYWRDADLPAIALASAYLDALLAQQEPA